LTTRRSGDRFRRIGAFRGGVAGKGCFRMNVRGYAMRSLRRGLARLRQAMPGTVRRGANAPPAPTMNRLQGIVWEWCCRAEEAGGCCPSARAGKQIRLVKFSNSASAFAWLVACRIYFGNGIRRPCVRELQQLNIPEY